MSKPIEEQVVELQQAIRAQETLRDSLGDDIVDATIATLNEKLAKLTSKPSDERKLVTCLFCDVVGSTRLAVDRDPEEVLHIIDGALRRMRDAVEMFGGNVSRYMGDGVLAFFGAPRALEGHAEQAILAGLEIQSRMIEYERRLIQDQGLSEFKVRVGINSGYVVAGYVAGAAGEYTVIGDTVNIASRLEGAVPPGGVLVGENTFRLAGGKDNFEVESWGELQIRGEPKPLNAYQIIRHQSQADRRRLQLPKIPLAGREAELKFLTESFAEYLSQEKTKIILIEGEAGIGKSRLRQEFTGWLEENHPATQIWLGTSFSYTSHTPYALVGSLIMSALNILDTDSMEQRREKLEQGANGMTIEQIHGIAAILAIPYPDDSLSALEPQSRRHAIVEAFKSFCSKYAKQSGLLLIFEDAHWADDISLDLIDVLVNEVKNFAFYCLMLTRIGARTIDRKANTYERLGAGTGKTLSLDYLSPGQTGNLIRSLLSTPQVSEEIIQIIHSVTQGNPFFIEEIISSYKEDGTLEPVNGDWQLARNSKGIQVPETIQGVLAERIDRLEPDLKSILQHAAIIGRIFWQKLLEELVAIGVDDHLSRLSDQEFIERHGRAMLVQDWEWIFSHALVQEVAYDSVLKEARREVHKKIAKWLEYHGADRLDELAPLIGLHYEQGRTWDKAIEYLSRAADRSKQIYALREANSFLDRAVQLAEDNPDAVDQQTLLSLLEKRGEVRGLAGEFESAVDDLNLVLEAARQQGDKVREQNLLIDMGMIYRRVDDYENAKVYLGQGLDIARRLDDDHGVADILYHLGTVVWSQGDNLKASPYHEEALQISQQMGLRDLVAVQALHGLGEIYFYSAQPCKAINLFKQSLEIARQIGDKSYEAENLQMIGLMHDGIYGLAEYDLGINYAIDALAVCQEAHLLWHMVLAKSTKSAFLFGLGDFQSGIDLMKQAIIQAKDIGSPRGVSLALDQLGNFYQALNLFKRAETIHANAIEIEGKIGTYFFMPRLKAELAIDRLRLGNLGVGPDLEEALEEAQSRDQLAHAVRCLEGLAELSYVRGDHVTAIHHAQELLRIAKAGELRELIAKAYLWQGKSSAAEGEAESAEEFFQQAVQLADSIGAPRLRWDVHEAMAEVYKAQGKLTLADQHLQVVREIVQQISANLKDPELRKGLPDF